MNCYYDDNDDDDDDDDDDGEGLLGFRYAIVMNKYDL